MNRLEEVILLPIYEYECRDCGKTTEFLVGIVRNAVKIICSHCGSKNLQKKISHNFVAKSGSIVGSHSGKTCCGREERCSKPPCGDEVTCLRE
jgi:putative FmdB family regulatory protein